MSWARLQSWCVQPEMRKLQIPSTFFIFFTFLQPWSLVAPFLINSFTLLLAFSTSGSSSSAGLHLFCWQPSLLCLLRSPIVLNVVSHSSHFGSEMLLAFVSLFSSLASFSGARVTFTFGCRVKEFAFWCSMMLCDQRKKLLTNDS